MLDGLIAATAPGGEIVLAGFYDRLSFAFPPPSCARRGCASPPNGAPADLAAVTRWSNGRLSLDGLITHRRPALTPLAYRTAFDDPACLKMILDWRTRS